MTQYACKVLSQPDATGVQVCTTWEQVQQTATPLVPEISKADADRLAIEIIGVLILAWGWRQLKTLIR